MLRKLSVIIVTAITVFVLAMYHEQLIAWLSENGQESFMITAVIATLMSLFPVIPYPIVGGVIGAAFGPFQGALLIWIGSTCASILFFLLIRYGGFEKKGQEILHGYKATHKITLLFERNAFLSITILRMIPVIPSIIINAYSALSRVPFFIYAIASALGKIPAMTLFAFVGDSIVNNPIDLIYMVLIYGVFLLAVYMFHRSYLRKIEKRALEKQDPSIIS
ncbi:TVP38/TMEM64 family protein [Paenalkalicoccus suaedae]|uniref:TVP38/TMEM64 family membrane protein n=1 Tax=Paenalkalicoccus suaedae TaxID=2592382 RepID=A0A859FD96_9BACI|nr:TVP38/TMEM64 family protein [Paenalkalicoccus suaedae]QKS71333.1 TVP38/TMEM64 family protein [Paenalkalicoccus suaedae]